MAALLGVALRLLVIVLLPLERLPPDWDARVLTDEAHTLLAGGNIYQLYTPAAYPPLIHHLIACAVGLGLDMRLLSTAADAGITLLLLRREKTAGWLYALSPVSLIVTSVIGNVDSIAALGLVAGLWWPWALGLGAAIKIWPAFYFPFVDRRHWWGVIFLVGAMAWALMTPGYRGLGYMSQQYQLGWGYSFFLLLLRRAGLQVDASRLAPYLFLAGLLATAWATRKRLGMERWTAGALALPVFMGHWGVNYGLWSLPVLLLAHKYDWVVLYSVWAVLHLAAMVLQADRWFVCSTLVAFATWLLALRHYVQHLFRSPAPT
ncbi:MAG: hypothetical protein H5T59_10590 [Anaerolineae bacterium]|nr:hypothetical protein [Anaerolineae bacterium]